MITYVCPCGTCEISPVTPEMLEAAEDVHDGWYDEGRIDWTDFIDRLEKGSDWDFGCDMASPTMKAIQKHIRAYRKL